MNLTVASDLGSINSEIVFSLFEKFSGLLLSVSFSSEAILIRFYSSKFMSRPLVSS